MTIPTALILAGVLWAAASAAFVAFGLWQMHRDAQDRENERVLANPILHPDVPVAPSPLIRMRVSHRSDEHATTPFSYQPRHAVIGHRDPLIAARLESTILFAERIEWELGRPLDEVGPREMDCTRTEGWTQPTFEFGVVTR